VVVGVQKNKEENGKLRSRSPLDTQEMITGTIQKVCSGHTDWGGFGGAWKRKGKNPFVLWWMRSGGKSSDREKKKLLREIVF